MDVDSVLVDTCVFLEATDEDRPHHSNAIEFLDHRTGLYLSAQIVREYLAVATRSGEANGLGMDLGSALSNIRTIREGVRLLPEECPILPTYLALLQRVPCHGKRHHDAFLVATALANGVKSIATFNLRHFHAFREFLSVTAPP